MSDHYDNPFKARRLEKGLTVEELAAQAGCSGSTIRFVEGSAKYSRATEERIARLLDIDVDAWQLRWEPAPPEEAA